MVLLRFACREYQGMLRPNDPQCCVACHFSLSRRWFYVYKMELWRLQSAPEDLWGRWVVSQCFFPLCHFFPGVGDRKGVRIQKALCIRSSRADGDDDCNLYTTLHHIWSAVYAVQDCQLLKIHTKHGKILYAFLYEKRVATMLWVRRILKELGIENCITLHCLDRSALS